MKRARATAVAAIAAIAAIGHLAVPKVAAQLKERRSSEASAQISAAWATLSRCMLGDANDTVGDANAVREHLHRIEVALAEPSAGAALGNVPDAWPGRCAPTARELLILVRRSTAPGARPVERAALDLVAHLTPAFTPTYAFVDFGQLRDEVQAMSLAPAPAAASVLAAPAPVRVRFDDASPPMVVDRDLLDLSASPPEGTALHLVFGGKEPKRCTLDGPAGAPLTHATCAAAGVDDAGFGSAPSSDSPLLAGLSCGEEGVDTSFARVLGDQLVFQCYGSPDYEMFAARLPKRGEAPSRAVKLGAAPEGRDVNAPYASCRSEDTLVIVARGRTSARNAPRSNVAFLTGNGWSKVVASTAAADHVTCRGRSVTLTGVEEISNGVFQIRQDRCTPDGCTSAALPMARLLVSPAHAPYDRREIGVADLDGKLLVAWRAGKYGLRARLAPLESIAAANDEVLFVATSAGDPLAVGVHTRGGAAVVLAQLALGGTRVFRVAGDGAIGTPHVEGAP